jgi:23S rRNA pseudoU1915 N3-methylase RlmH
MNFLQRIERVFFWLSAASSDNLDACPAWERRKYVAFGATVLVPSIFAIIACAYALSTLTDNWLIIAPVSLVWSFIILTVDRALLATYRAYQGFFRKAAQFSLRMVVAALMGITISHPLTLLLFKDTISSVVEKHRQGEIEAARETSKQQKVAVEARIVPLEAEIAKQRENWNATFSAKFLDENGKPVEKPLTDDEKRLKADREAKIAEAVAPGKTRLETLDKEMAKLSADYQKIAEELNHWQTEFEREVNGQRSGIIGLGPRAKSIQEDQLTWRRAESARLSGVLDTMTKNRVALVAEIKAAEDGVNAALDAKAAEEAAANKAEQARILALKQKVQTEQADQFVSQQNAIRETLKTQIDTLLLQAKNMHEEITAITADETTRIAKINAEPRRDILTQTLALHELFESGAQGGTFALVAYLVLTMLFMLVDTIPLIVKFFSKPGPYDTMLDREEMGYEGERKAFLEGFSRQMKELGESKLLNLTRNKTLERALVTGVDGARSAKEFLVYLMDLEREFEEKNRAARELAATSGVSRTADALEEMSRNFYADLRARMEQFFREDGRHTPATGRA